MAYAQLTGVNPVYGLYVENVFPATSRVLDAENTAWDAAQKWLRQAGVAAQFVKDEQGIE